MTDSDSDSDSEAFTLQDDRFESIGLLGMLTRMLNRQSSQIYYGSSNIYRQVDEELELISSSGGDDSHFSEITFTPGMRFSRIMPSPPECADTSILNSSDLKQQMTYESGSLHPLRRDIRRALSTVPSFLPLKEAGVFTKMQQMSKGQITSVKCHYLPGQKDPKLLLHLRDRLFCGIYNQQGNLFMSASQDARIRIFDSSPGHWKQIKTVDCKDVGWSILDVDYSHAGDHIIYSSWSEYIHLCNIRGENECHEALNLSTDEPSRTAIFSMKFSPDDSEILAGANNGYLYIYNRSLKKRTLKIGQVHADDVNAVSFADDSGHIFYSGGEDGLIKVWDRRNLRENDPEPVGKLAGHYDAVVFIDSRNDARYLISNSKDQSIKLWDIRKFATEEGILSSLNAVSDQNWDYRTQNYSGKIFTTKLPGDCSVMTYHGHCVGRTLIRARFSPLHSTGQRFIYCGDSIGRIFIYDILTGKIIRTIKPVHSVKHQMGHRKDVVRDVSWHPFENNLISSGWDGKCISWQAQPCSFSQNTNEAVY